MATEWEQLADILVNYSTEVRPAERVLITLMEVETFPLARAVHAAAIRAGGLPQVEFQSAYLERDLLLHGSQAQLEWAPEMQAHGMAWADVYIGLRGARNPHEFTGIAPEKIAAHKRALGRVSALRNEQTRWVLVRVPNEALAQQAEMGLDEMMAFFFSATLRDWAAEAKRYRELCTVFQAAETVRLVGLGTDLTFSTKGRLYEVADGHLNMPDGEIFTAPVDDSAQGVITFDFPGVYVGQKVEGIQLEFQGGEVVRASARTNQALLEQLLGMDAGARRLGEFGVGTNFGIQRFCYDILYDEKIGGTVHLALGRAYAENKGVNQSALHWDIVKDLRQEGQVWLDGRLVLERGQFLI
ncbi:MAG: aminopeptidase [Anaerolineales bacterium]|nr:aminopeptidase [Anaerolineales bacterium]